MVLLRSTSPAALVGVQAFPHLRLKKPTSEVPMPIVSPTRRRAVLLAAVSVFCATGSLISGGPTPASAAACSDVELVFARGTGEAQGPSVLQGGTFNALKSGVGGKSVSQYSVVYPASADQNATPGQQDMVKRISTVAAQCPNTKFVLGGYSQGGTVVDLSIGVSLFGPAPSGAIPANLAPRIAAIVTFGNPLGNQRLAAASPTYSSRIKEFCAAGDPVCRNGADFTAHLAYLSNGDTTKAGQFAASKVQSSTPNPGDPSTTTTVGPTPTTATPPPTTRPWWSWWSRWWAR